MPRIVNRLPQPVKRQVRRIRSKARDEGLYARCQIVLLDDRGRTRADVAESVGCSVSWGDRVLARFRSDGVTGLFDRRADNGTVKLDDAFLAQLYEMVDGSPRDHGFPRPTWTCELLARVVYRLPDVSVHPASMSRALALIGARLGRPKPTVGCPWPTSRKNRRLAGIRRALATLPPGHVAVYLDPFDCAQGVVDIHLNPKIGLDWMNRGKQKRVVTPGKNVKRYLCGAQPFDSAQGPGDRRAGVGRGRAQGQHPVRPDAAPAGVRRLPGAGGPRRARQLPDPRLRGRPRGRRGAGRAGGAALLSVVEGLPPYCPDHNRIERTWREVHDHVTRNHTCQDMDELMREVTSYLHARNRRKRATFRRAA